MRRCPKCGNEYEDAVGFCPRDGEVLQESKGELVGRVLDGKYEVEGFIAQGGMGAVYRARHILLGDRVVIKTLRSEMRTNSEWLRRFQREGRAARSFRHPNAVTVYDLSAASDGLVYLVMEYVEGETLDKELKRRGRLTPPEALELLRPVADVLDAAHARGVVHRDLKPENIILGRTETGQRLVKVLDLGIAKLKGMPDGETIDGPLTVAGQVLGTPYYMSPEQWGETPRDGNPEVDGRADVYALGVITFELVAGSKPLGGRTLSELRHEHVSKPLPLLHDVAPDVPEAFGRAVARAMAKDRGERPATAGEFIAESRAALSTSADTKGDGPRARAADTSAPPVSFVTVADAALAPPPGERDTAVLHARKETEAPSAEARTGAAELPTITTDIASPQTPPDTETQTAYAAPHANAAPVARRAGLAGSAQGGAEVVRSGAEAARGGAEVARKETRRRASLIAVALVALVVVAGVVGWMAWSRMQDGASDAGETNAARTPEASAEAPRVEALSYWLEAFGTSATKPRRVAETAAELTSGEYFKFHFVPRQRGFLYIVGPGGDGNAHMIFLGARGAKTLKTNQVAAGADFGFPLAKDSFILLDRNPGAEDYTIIFSPTPLVAPAALTRNAEHLLSLDELKELEDFRAQHAGDAVRLNVKGEAGAADRAVSVTVPETRDASRPVIFDLRIEHK
ncbi:MAG TPA: protein kinase [Pyrinomonadaceae bacterium]|nr:protein kinase [Pyrinomonadaceae bacterium]